MKRIVITKVSPTGDTITIGFFHRDGGESTQTMTLHKSLFPEDSKQGDELIFTKKANILSIIRDK